MSVNEAGKILAKIEGTHNQDDLDSINFHGSNRSVLIDVLQEQQANFEDGI